jgi:xylose dehydrogenase (NAD/NADP)
MKNVRWGILGCARIAERAIIPALKQAKDAELLGIAARDASRARKWAVRFAIPRAYPDYDALLEDPDIDAVYIPLPNHLHAPWATRAARAGKHVLCEKPLALDGREAARMFLAADRAGVRLLEAFMYRFHPLFETALRLANGGGIGEVRTVRSTFTFRLASGLEDYRWAPEMGGGSLYDVGCYPLNAARTIFQGEPVSVYARARFDGKRGIDMAAALVLEFPGGRQALLDCAFDAAFQSELEIAGTDGRIVVPRAFSAKQFDVAIEIHGDDKVRTVLVPAANAYVRMIRHFQDAILRGRPLRYGEADARGNARLLAAALRSAKSGRAVRLA